MLHTGSHCEGCTSVLSKPSINFLPRLAQHLPGVLVAQPLEGVVQSAPHPLAAVLRRTRLAGELRQEVLDPNLHAEEAELEHARGTDQLAHDSSLLFGLP